MTVLDEGWVATLVEGSSTATVRPGLDAVVALAVGTDDRVVLELRDGRVVGTTTTDPQVEIPLTAAQVSALVAGELSLARDYMRGDVKPVGSSGPLAVVIEVFEDDRTWTGFRT